MKLWLNRRLWRGWLCYYWVRFKVGHTENVIQAVIQSPWYPAVLEETLWDFLVNQLTGFYLYPHNSCWHRSALAIKFCQYQKQAAVVKLGAANADKNWSLHVWVEDRQNENLSDLIPEEQTFNSFFTRQF